MPIVRVDPRDNTRELVVARGGLIPGWMKEMPKVPHINARAETVHKLPLFREAFAKRRALITATGTRLGGEDVLSATIIVGEPNPLVAGVHDRMPVMLMPEDYDRWLDPSLSVDEARTLLRPYDAKLMKACEVSRTVNSVKNDTPECVEPIA